MTIYIEDFLIQNTLINFCLIRLIYLTLKPNSKTFNMILASFVGSIFSVITILFLQNNLILNIAKIVCSVTILLIAFKQNLKQFIFSFLLLFLYTFAFGGAVTNFSTNSHLTTFGAVIISKHSLEIITLILITTTYIFETITKHLKLKIKTSNFIYSLTLTQKNNTVKINAYLDTGNLLSHNGHPLIILDLDTFLKLNNINILDFYLNKSEEINTGTVNGNNKLKIFKIQKIKIENKKNSILLENQYIAVNTNNCFKNSNFKALLSPLFL